MNHALLINGLSAGGILWRVGCFVCYRFFSFFACVINDHGLKLGKHMVAELNTCCEVLIGNLVGCLAGNRLVYLEI